MSQVINLFDESPFYRVFSANEKLIADAIEMAIELSAARMGEEAGRLFSHRQPVNSESKAA